MTAHDHGARLSADAFSPAADACPYVLANLPCGCQDVHYACGAVDREHDHVECPGIPPLRWGVFVRDLRDGLEWYERHRWTDGDLVPLPDQAAAEARATEISGWHPEWEVEARQTADPLPGTFRESFAEWLP